MWTIKTILHPTDFSDCSQDALQVASALARDHGANLIVLHVTSMPDLAYEGYGTPGSSLQTEEYQTDVRQQMEKLQPPDAQKPFERRLAEGDPTGEILGVAAETGSDLIVMGTHGRTGLRHLLLGSVAEQVVRKAPCPVLTLKTHAARTTLPVHTILFPTDFSENAEQAFPLACSLAREYGARIVVLHVTPPPLWEEEVQVRRDPDDYYGGLWNELRQVQAPDGKINVEHRLEEGDAAKRIVEVADEIEAGLIVMGKHGRSGIGRLLVGSVVEHVLRESTTPVLTVKSPSGKKHI